MLTLPLKTQASLGLADDRGRRQGHVIPACKSRLMSLRPACDTQGNPGAAPFSGPRSRRTP
ncbi:hypothetical protein HNR06_005317 [Nocardiopsis arvandica]|uniref:Uncharacterized protein n=1 Tax=Nocardiopsis sinuspersici TaxID=501010 RepID=A0A7Z0BLC8_9ACTN|nr:hypothetical protein [Nocardiopsis sinuspersici]